MSSRLTGRLMIWAVMVQPVFSAASWSGVAPSLADEPPWSQTDQQRLTGGSLVTPVQAFPSPSHHPPASFWSLFLPDIFSLSRPWLRFMDELLRCLSEKWKQANSDRCVTPEWSCGTLTSAGRVLTHRSSLCFHCVTETIKHRVQVKTTNTKLLLHVAMAAVNPFWNTCPCWFSSLSSLSDPTGPCIHFSFLTPDVPSGWADAPAEESIIHKYELLFAIKKDKTLFLLRKRWFVLTGDKVKLGPCKKGPPTEQEPSSGWFHHRSVERMPCALLLWLSCLCSGPGR